MNSLTREQRLLVESHLWLVDLIAHKVRKRLPHHADHEELVQSGALGLIAAAQRFDGDRQIQFRAYAAHRIHGAILDSLRVMDHAPRELRRQIKNLECATEQLSVRLQRSPTESELAEELASTVENVRKLRRRAHELMLLSIDANISHKDDTLKFEPAAPVDLEPDQIAIRSELRTLVERAIQRLPMRERAIVRLHDCREIGMAEIGTALGITDGRISQVRKQALARLKEELWRLGIRSAAGSAQEVA